ncbi:MAG: sigma-70 family RNA polymerase sigma factor [Caldilineaceae bacterium]|nr:sigma-70 family RNA polymerase sigma factor [Caldilineaceae bacterium]
MPSDSHLHPDTPDGELMQYIRQGDQSALMVFYARHSSAVYGLALRVLHDAGLAEEVTQDTFLKVWNQADRWDSAKGKLTSWLLTVTRHTAIDRYRKLQRRPAVSDLWEEAESTLGQMALVDTPQWTDSQLLARLFAQLPPEQAHLVQLAFYQGMSHSELAESLHLPLGTVKTRLRLGLQKLKVLWQEAVDEMGEG